MAFNKSHIVVLDAATMRGPLLRPKFAHRWTEYPLSNPQETTRRIKNAHILIINKVVITAKDIAAAPHLKLIAITATGVNNINLEACKKHAVCVCNIRHYANRGLAEHTIGLIYALARGVVFHTTAALPDNGKTAKFSHPIWREFMTSPVVKSGLSVAALPVGQQRRWLKKMACVRCFLKSPRKQHGLKLMPLKKLLTTSDIISLHCPLIAQNAGIIGAEELALMKPEAFLINTARGALIDNKALAQALKKGLLGGAGIDVLEKEPPPKNHPLLRLKHPRLIITPHVAWASQKTLENMRLQLLANLEKFHAGQPQNVVIE